MVIIYKHTIINNVYVWSLSMSVHIWIMPIQSSTRRHIRSAYNM